VLLKVNLIQSPEVHVWLNGQLSKFFYAPLVEAYSQGDEWTRLALSEA